MRVAALTLLVTFAACGDPDVSGETLVIDTPSFTVQPGEEKFYCYYTTLPFAQETGIYRMSSSMPAGSHHMIVLKTRSPEAPDGTLAECEVLGMAGGGLTDIPLWLYASQEPEFSQVMPEGVGMTVAANQPVIVNMHYLNQSDVPITASVHLELEAFRPGTTFTKAHAFVTFNDQIDVAPGAMGGVGGSCDVPADAQFILMTTHSHKYTTSARVKDGDQMVLETLDWAHATVEQWREPYYRFQSGKLDYRCEYHNTTNQPLETGESAIANEMCMAIGAYFPASGDTFCYNSFTFTL